MLVPMWLLTLDGTEGVSRVAAALGRPGHCSVGSIDLQRCVLLIFVARVGLVSTARRATTICVAKNKKINALAVDMFVCCSPCRYVFS